MNFSFTFLLGKMVFYDFTNEKNGLNLIFIKYYYVENIISRIKKINFIDSIAYILFLDFQGVVAVLVDIVELSLLTLTFFSLSFFPLQLAS